MITLNENVYIKVLKKFKSTIFRVIFYYNS